MKKMNKKGLLIVFSGPSGCGKGTVLKELMAQDKNIFYSVSATTRSPRPGEENGVHYYFLQRDEFEELIAQDGMLEYANYVGNYYGTPKKAVYEQIEQGKDVVLEIEVQGAMQIKEKCPDAVFIFVMPPSMSELRHRLVDRQTEDMDTINHRLETAVNEMRYAKQYHYVVVNDTVSEAVKNISAIIQAEKNKVTRMNDFIEEVLKNA